MNTKRLVFISLLLSLGYVLHTIIPGFGFGMKPDMLLIMMFIGISLIPNTKATVLLGIGAGIISALTTSFPGGQIPNLIEKPITAFSFLILFLLLKSEKRMKVKVSILTAVCTLVSGLVFLYTALLISGLPAGFVPLFISVVIPAAIVNLVATTMIFPVVFKIKNRMNI